MYFTSDQCFAMLNTGIPIGIAYWYHNYYWMLDML